MSEKYGGERVGLFSALSNIAATLLVGGRTRLELLGNEIEEAKLRAVHLLLTSLAMLFCFGIAVLLAVALLTSLFWDYRQFILGVSTCLFLILWGFLFAAFKRATQRQDHVFSASIAELEEDLRQLKAAAGYESPTE